jgi:hypothetical protein
LVEAVVLEKIGLKAGEAVRFRRGETGRWVQGRVARVNPDGSIDLYVGAKAPAGFEKNYMNAMCEGCSCEPSILVVYLLQGAVMTENIKTWIMQQHPIAIKDYQTFRTMCQSFNTWDGEDNDFAEDSGKGKGTTWSWA